MTRRLMLPLATLTLAAVLFVVGGIGFVSESRSAGAPVSAGALVTPGASSPDKAIPALQRRLKEVPKDYVAWASLGLAYIEAARLSADPSYYPKAEGVLERSLELNRSDNFGAAAGLSALAAARHDFVGAKHWAERGLAINGSSALLYGALNDAETQLGRYPEAFAAAQRMVDISPDTTSLARASYTWELRGDLERATANMQRALDDAVSPAQIGFARYYLGNLAFHAGNAAGALAQFEAGLRAHPDSAALRQGVARAEAALGRTDAALVHFAEAVSRVPEPGWLIEYGELLDSLGRHDEASAQYDLFETEQKLFAAAGVAADVDATLFYADHGDPAEALRVGAAGLAQRSFLEMQDAQAWALHVNGRDAEALELSRRARALGMRNALFEYHAGMISLALGDRAGARDLLRSALEINPNFSPLHAPVARSTLAALR